MLPWCQTVGKYFENYEKIIIWQFFLLISVIKKWNIDKVRRTTGEKGSRIYKSRNFAKFNVKSLSDDESYHEEENISENGDKEGYLFFF